MHFHLMTRLPATSPFALFFALFCLLCPIARGQPAPSDAEEKEACIRNLKQIYAAIQSYQVDHKDIPNWLSDLVPKYISDTTLLVCPVCRRTGKTESPPLADPKIACSYLFEFCPVPLGMEVAHAPHRTRREWKRRQMGLVGSTVPLIRCRHHSPILNVSFDGRVYESPLIWEETVASRVDRAELTPSRLFANEPAARVESAPPPARRQFPPRDPKARKESLDLTEYYNAALTEPWRGAATNDMPAGLLTLGGVPFDVRGVVQLASRAPAAKDFPHQVTGLRVRQKCRRIHFLHATDFGSAADEGKQVATYAVCHGTNRFDVPITFGRNVHNWRTTGDQPTPDPDLRVAWTSDPRGSKGGRSTRLFVTTWQNLAPDAEIEYIDLLSTMAPGAAPFLVAITLD